MSERRRSRAARRPRPVRHRRQPPSPSVTILDLPFPARALRGPGSEVAVSVATSGLLPLARPKSADPKATLGAEPEDAAVAVVWGEDGGAALSLTDGRIDDDPDRRRGGRRAGGRRDAARRPARLARRVVSGR